MATTNRVPTADDFRLCQCGGERYFHEDGTGRCSCKASCRCTSFRLLTSDLAFQRQLDQHDRWAQDGRDYYD